MDSARHRFMNGECNVFTSCLYDRTGWKVGALFEGDVEYGLIHMFCVNEKDQFVDVRGVFDDPAKFFSFGDECNLCRVDSDGDLVFCDDEMTLEFKDSLPKEWRYRPEWMNRQEYDESYAIAKSTIDGGSYGC